jgi:ribose transport system substrate-binding protein
MLHGRLSRDDADGVWMLLGIPLREGPPSQRLTESPDCRRSRAQSSAQVCTLPGIHLAGSPIEALSKEEAMKTKCRILFAALPAVGLLGIALCAASARAEDKKPVVGLVMKSLANEFFKSMEEGARKFAAEDGTFTLVPVGMNSETDIDTQISAVENFVTQKVDIICVAPADSVGLVAPVKKAIGAGITVVNFDVKLDDKALAKAGLKDLVFVGPDNKEGAYLAGQELAKKLGKGGKVFIIEGNPGADNAKMRKAGFDKAAKEAGLKVLVSRTAHWETEEANTLVTNLLTQHPDVQGIMAANDSMALGVVKALDAAGRSGKVLVVGFDNIPAVQKLVKDGKVLATIDQFGPDMAANCIKTGFRMKKGDKLKGWIKTPVKLITVTDLG